MKKPNALCLVRDYCFFAIFVFTIGPVTNQPVGCAQSSAAAQGPGSKNRSLPPKDAAAVDGHGSTISQSPSTAATPSNLNLSFPYLEFRPNGAATGQGLMEYPTAFTVSVWARFDRTEYSYPAQHIVGSCSEANRCFAIEIYQGGISCAFGTGSQMARVQAPVGILKHDEWTHLSCSRNAEGTVFLHINGKFEASLERIPYVPPDDGEPITIGGGTFIGDISNLRISSATTSATSFPPPLRSGSTIPGSLAEWTLSEGTGPGARDTVSNKAMIWNKFVFWARDRLPGPDEASVDQALCGSANECNRLGISRYKARDFPAAEKLFEEAIYRDPTHEKALYNLACTFALMRNEAAAVEALQQLAMLPGDDARAHIAKASTDPDFDFIRNGETFRSFVREQSKPSSVARSAPRADDAQYRQGCISACNSEEMATTRTGFLKTCNEEPVGRNLGEDGCMKQWRRSCMQWCIASMRSKFE